MTDDFTQHEAWQHAHRLVLNVYLLTEQFPPEEQIGLTRRVRDTATSIPLSLAEAATGRSSGAVAPFDEATAAANALAYMLLLARDLGYITGSTFTEFGEAIARLRRLIRQMQTDYPQGETDT